MNKESEVKNIEWLRKEFDDLFNGKSILTVGKSVIDGILNQLDEPEVPKQEEIEAKIQELIETYKQEEDVYSNPENGWISGFNEDLKNLVEEEQKYRVLDGNTTLLGRINGLMLTTVEILEYYPEYAPTFDLTEQEIKDYDERFWPFAVKVEELKE